VNQIEALDEIERLRSAIEAIRQATIEGRIPRRRGMVRSNHHVARLLRTNASAAHELAHCPHRRRAQFVIAGALPAAHHTIHHHQQATD
jgi:hypothetical protein